jgi:plasmid maintenance system antidote protein VapI
MKLEIDIIKGVHPGFILERELKKRKLRKGQFALSLHEYPQTLVSITKGNRKMNTSLALKIERALGLEEGYFMILQVYHDIAEEKKKEQNRHPDLTKFRPVLFWDTKIEKINWLVQKDAVIKRIFERGNTVEKNEITLFYGIETINQVLDNNEKQA